MGLETEIRVLTGGDAGVMRALLGVLGAAFEDAATYTARQPDDAYLDRWLSLPDAMAVVALRGGRVVGGVVAYVLAKFEQARSEVYLYDLAVDADHRRQGIASGLIRAVQREAKRRGAHSVYVQVHREDGPAIALYTKFGRRVDVLHFEIGADDDAP